MYDDHYGLTGRPFQLTPDPRFWFDTATHRKAMAYLGYGLAQGEGFIVITGDVGAGKTTLVGHLVETLDSRRLRVLHIVSTAVDPDDLLRVVAGQLSVDSHGLSKAALLSAIERALNGIARDGRRILLIVDEVRTRSGAARIETANRLINTAIRYMSDLAQHATIDVWSAPLASLGTGRGDCEDYALEKRRRLIAEGVPAEALSMAVVVTHRGERHAVLIVAFEAGDMVLDNLTPWPTPWAQLNYTWVERQVAGSSTWTTIA